MIAAVTIGLTDQVCYRMHVPRWAWAPTSGLGAARQGGRLNRAGVEALYLAVVSRYLVALKASLEQFRSAAVRMPGASASELLSMVQTSHFRQSKEIVAMENASKIGLAHARALSERLKTDRKSPPIVAKKSTSEIRAEMHQKIFVARPELQSFVMAENLQAELAKLIQQPQCQDATTGQLRDLHAFANRLGLYDAADLIKSIVSKK